MLHSARTEKARPRITQTTAQRQAVDDVYYGDVGRAASGDYSDFVGEVGGGGVVSVQWAEPTKTVKQYKYIVKR